MNETQTPDTLLQAYETAQAPAPAGPAWLHALRTQGFDAYRESGLPTIRNEEWRYTSVSPIAKISWRVAPQEFGSRLRPLDIARFLPAGLDVPRLVFINGRLVTRLSTQGRLAAGLHFLGLREALESKGPSARVVQAHLARHAEIEGDAFTALNTAFFENGAFIHVQRGLGFDQPVQVLHLTVAGDQPVVAQPRALIILDESSRANVIEIFAGLGAPARFANSVSEMIVGENAHLEHSLVQFEDDLAYHVGTQRVRVDRNGSLTSRCFALGAALARNNLHCVLNGEGAQATLGGLFMGRGSQHVDEHVHVEHSKPHGTSRQLYRGVLDGASHGVFSGKVVVRPDAQKTDAQQTNNNLLLSDDARIDTKPQLEIYADDVKCAHGATSGRLNEEALFFLRSRGLGEREARALLTYAFAAELIETVEPQALREALSGLVQARLT